MRAAAVVLFALVGLGCGAGGVEGGGTNNLILIAVDSLRARGLDREIAPSLGRLADEGTRFTRAYAPAPWGAASMAGILTGLGPEAHGIRSLEDELAPGVETLAGRLAREGYDCRSIVSDFLMGSGRGLDRGFDVCSMGAARGPNSVTTNSVVEEAIEYLESRSEAPEPFFLLLHFADPSPALKLYEHTRLPEGVPQLKGGEDLAFLKVMARDASEGELAAMLALWEGEVRHVDQGIGELLGAVDRLGLDQSTLVVALGTHGIELGERGGVGSGHSLREELVNVPLIVRAPAGSGGLVPAGATVAVPLSLTAVHPTALSLLGLAPNAGLAADSLESFSLGPVVLAVDYEPRDLSLVAHQRAVVDQNYKLIRDLERGTVELFDLELDPDEQEDVSALFPDELTRLEQHLSSIPIAP